jgi:hypothetical protein
LIARSETQKAEADIVAEVAQASAQVEPLPDLPADCREEEATGVRDSDRADVAIKKLDNVITQERKRKARCIDWFDRLRAARERGQGF